MAIKKYTVSVTTPGVAIADFDRAISIRKWMFGLHLKKGGAKDDTDKDDTDFVVELTKLDLDALESFIDGLPSTKKEKFRRENDKAREVLLNERTPWGQNYVVFYVGLAEGNDSI